NRNCRCWAGFTALSSPQSPVGALAGVAARARETPHFHSRTHHVTTQLHSSNTRQQVMREQAQSGVDAAAPWPALGPPPGLCRAHKHPNEMKANPDMGNSEQGGAHLLAPRQSSS